MEATSASLSHHQEFGFIWLGWGLDAGMFSDSPGASQVQPRLRINGVEQDADGDFDGAGGEA